MGISETEANNVMEGIPAIDVEVGG